MSKSKVFIGISLSFALGIFLVSRFFIDLRWIYILAGFFAAVFAFAFFKASKTIYLAVLFLFFICAGAARFNSAEQPNEYTEWFEQKVKWEGYIVEDPDVRADKQMITLTPKDFSQRVL